MSRFVGVLLVCVLLAGCGGGSSGDCIGSSSGNRIGSSSGNRIAFVSDRDGDREIFVMNADGTDVRQLTENDGSEDGPSWSPDGDRIAFASDRNGWREIFVMNADGTDVRQLTENEDRGRGVRDKDHRPSWSPDGDRIAFDRWIMEVDGILGLHTSEIFVMNADGTEVCQLTGHDDPEPMRWNASWSPDGDRIAFHRSWNGDHGIFVMNADGTDVRQLTENDGDAGGPSWSPDGDRIAFRRSWNGDHEIFVMNADGTNTYSTGQQGFTPSFGG